MDDVIEAVAQAIENEMYKRVTETEMEDGTVSEKFALAAINAYETAMVKPIDQAPTDGSLFLAWREG